jgi:hypothetical protein
MRKFTQTLGLLAVTALLLAPAGRPAADEDRVRLEITVTAATSGEPIKNASVYVRYKKDRFLRKDKDVSLTVKTNPDGKATVPGIPQGRVLVQVVAEGWKTFGESYEIESPKQSIEIKLERPKKWY